MRTSMLFIVLYFILSCNVYGQEIPTIMQRDLLVGKDMFRNIMLGKNSFAENITASLADSNIEYISSILWSYIFNIKLSGNYAYCILPNGLAVLDITDKSNPVNISQLYLGGNGGTGTGNDIFISGSCAYVAYGSSGLKVINIASPSSPSLVGTYDTPGSAKSVFVIDSYAYVADGSKGLQVIDISIPSSPSLAGTYDTPGSAFSVYVNDSYAYVADYGSGLQVINISNPSSPSLVGVYDTPGYAYGVCVSGNYAYVADYSSGLQVININNPSSPSLVGSYDTPGYAFGVYVSGNYAYVADGGSGLQVININTPTSPSLVGSYDTPGSAWGVYVSDNYAYVADQNKGLQVININTPTSPLLVGTYDKSERVYSVYVSGNYAYVANGEIGLQVINISTPSTPLLVGGYDTPGTAFSVYVNDSYAYVADLTSGLQVINISNPSSPSLVGNYDTPGSAWGVMVSGSYAYVADGGSGLQIINVSNPASPVLAGSYGTSVTASGVYVSGGYAYVAGYGSGLQVINISNPSSPSLVGSYDTPGTAYGVMVSESYAYVVDYDKGLQIINMSNPASPVLVGSYDTPGYAFGVYVSGNYAYVADVGSGLQVININTPTSPSLVSSYDTPGSAYSVFVNDRYIYVADFTSLITLKSNITGGGGTTEGHFKPAYNTTGNNSTILVQTTTAVKTNNNPFMLSIGDEIALYTPLPDTICCGVGRWSESDMAITVWGDNDQTTAIKEGFTSGQEYTFHLWDASESKEYRFGTATFSTGSSTYSTNGMSIVDSLNFSTIAQLSINLLSGWNIISSNVTPSNLLMTEIFKDIVSNVVIVKNIAGKVYWPRYSINQIGNWNVVDGYQIYMSNAATLTIHGQRVNLSTPISLPTGWGMIAYLPNLPMSPARACSTIRDKIVIMKDVSGKVYWPRYNIDQIGTMQVGKGYQIYLSSAGTLTYPASVSKEGSSLIAENRNRGQLSTQHFAYIRGTGSNATILLRMNEKPVINGTAVEVSDEIGVYTPEGICAGAGVWNGDDIVITVWGDNSETMNIDGLTDGQAYTFKLWDKSTNAEKDVSVIAESGNLTYSENGITVISYEKSSALPDNFVLRQNYPNPFNPSTRIEYQIKTQSEVTLSIYNTAGQLIRMLVQSAQPAGVYSIEWDGKNSTGIQVTSGIYLYRLKAGSFVETRKMVMMK